MMKNCVKSMELENGLVLTLWDTSRRISADAFVVKALFSIEFALTEGEAEACGLALSELIRTLGSKTGRFEKSLERHFINASQKEAVFAEMTDSYLRTSLPYLAHPDFAKGVVRRQLVEKRGRYGSPGNN